MAKTFQPGKYYVGDPCYVIDDDKWDEFLEPYWATGGGGEFEFEGHPVAAYSTMYGDGTYHDQRGREYSVDAGMIGVIPIALCVKRSEQEIRRLGNIVDFTEPFSTDVDGGTIIIGPIEIETGDE